LIKTIEDYRLYQYDQVSVFDYAVNDNAANPQLPQTYDNKSATSRSINKLTTINDVKVLQVNDGSTMEEISQQYDVPVHSLMKNNRDIKSKSVAIAAHSTIFLSPRRNSYRGKDKWHYVKQGENIESIARLYAIKESYLMRKNNLKR
jgi:LysM repeat protein